MALVTRGRLSVQRVEPAAWAAIEKLAEQGGWDDIDLGGKGKGKSKAAGNKPAPTPRAAKKGNKGAATEDEPADGEEDEEDEEAGEVAPSRPKKASGGRAPKRKAEEPSEAAGDAESGPRRRSTRLKR